MYKLINKDIAHSSVKCPCYIGRPTSVQHSKPDPNPIRNLSFC